MPVFARIISFESSSGRFNDEEDSRKINEVLEKLQEQDATVTNIRIALTPNQKENTTIAIYLIEYEADAPVKA